MGTMMYVKQHKQGQIGFKHLPFTSLHRPDSENTHVHCLCVMFHFQAMQTMMPLQQHLLDGRTLLLLPIYVLPRPAECSRDRGVFICPTETLIEY